MCSTSLRVPVVRLAGIAAALAMEVDRTEAAAAPPVHVPRPDLSRFDLLLGRSDDPEPPGGNDTAPELQASVFFA